MADTHKCCRQTQGGYSNIPERFHEIVLFELIIYPRNTSGGVSVNNLFGSFADDSFFSRRRFVLRQKPSSGYL
ncbi:hypothetical protein KBY29_19830 [Ruegeria pomeroyi]|nr:hypothetical protein [Ruegeria pomeroyi]